MAWLGLKVLPKKIEEKPEGGKEKEGDVEKEGTGKTCSQEGEKRPKEGEVTPSTMEVDGGSSVALPAGES